ncbi:cyclic nucleotide-binding domain-containing protein, partial [Aurantimonas marina]|uniref:cyclic nucleotide-binding domain-containing protein n=1 Tax=Aurantimonas marina TaxID=2780508 RepID=UPI0019CF5308
MLASTVAQARLPTHPFETGHPALPSPCGSQRPQLVKFLQAGEEVYAAGDPAKHIYRIEFGAIRVFRLLADGRRQVSAFHVPGEIFGFAAGVDHEFFAEAINATGIQPLRLSAIENVSRDLFPVALQSLTMMQKHLLILARHAAIERLAAFLVDMAERQGDLEHIHLPMSRMDIADHLGLTIETVS